jgi:hypothetical protein
MIYWPYTVSVIGWFHGRVLAPSLDLMATPTEHIAVWILEAAEAEALREPDLIKRRLDSFVLGEVMAAHSLESVDIDRGVKFLVDRRLLDAVGKDGGVVSYPTTDGEDFLREHREQTRRFIAAKVESIEKKKWTRSEKIALASFILSVVSFFVGIHVGQQGAKKSDSMPTVSPPTNSAAAALPKSP